MAFKRDDPLMEIIEGEKKELTKYDVLEDPKYKDVSENFDANFEALHASLMVPLVYQDQVIGSLNLGEKKSGKPFNREDIDLAAHPGQPGSRGHRKCPAFSGKPGKAAHGRRAQHRPGSPDEHAAGGMPRPLKDLILPPIPSRPWKSGEISMISSIWVKIKPGLSLVMLPEKVFPERWSCLHRAVCFACCQKKNLSVSESMMRANRRLKKDVKTGMFVALLFAVLNSTDRTLTLCSAGQTQPIHLSAKTGEAKLIDTEGDTFPFRILDDANYLETEIRSW